MNRVVLVDSPVANVANIARALRAVGAEVVLSADPDQIAEAERVVLPGVGSFVAAMKWLRESGVAPALSRVVERGVPLLGICVGHQALFESSEEMGSTPGLGLLKGTINRFATKLPVPQIGWNRVVFGSPRLFEGVPSGTPFYFVNSYRASGVTSEAARSEYGGSFTAAAEQGSVFGLQFHPEKSSLAGLRVLRNFVELRA